MIGSPVAARTARAAGTGLAGRGIPASGAPRCVRRHLKEIMRPLRWFLIAFAAGCASFLAVPHSATAATRAAVVATHHHHRLARHHATPQLRATHTRLANRTPASRTGRHPANPANRTKTRHTGISNTRGRGHSTYGVLPHAPNAAPDDRYGALRVGATDDPGARLNRMLESRGPPRAGPIWTPAHRGFDVPLPRTSPAPSASHLDIAQSTPRAAGVRLSGSPRPTSSTWSDSRDRVLPSVIEGAAAGHDMPSSGGFTP